MIKTSNIKKSRLATCCCGQLSVECLGEPELVSLCHCFECQRRTGSTFGVAAFYDRNCVFPHGETKLYTRPSDTGYDVHFHFCPVCGSTVYWEPVRKPELAAVAVGSFADKDFPFPQQEVYEEYRHHWVNWN